MKKIFILAASVLFISSCNMKKSNPEQALQDSIKVADSISVLEYEKEQAMDDDDEIRTSRGYSTDPNYKPTISSDGKYHTIDGKARQKQFQGSLEQKQQLEMMDNY
ncbi:hypothetical protein [Bacteroides faecium]|uniref:Lipoprotein n=1 Tax=Bacteroides faecium TaxID=2715212 RepID=A0A6H0KI18_9BACE|nr:hypothetical protein [Bacteroides faecium]QIU92899.1 hypothetical protein BacF7301_01465 [Bacteroides faecium]